MEQEKFETWYAQEKAKGLVDIKYFAGGIDKDSTLEGVFREINQVNELLESPKSEVKRDDVF